MLASAPKPAEFKPIGKGKKFFFLKEQQVLSMEQPFFSLNLINIHQMVVFLEMTLFKIF